MIRVIVQGALGVIIAASAVGAMWFTNRRISLARRIALVECVAALALVATALWDPRHWMLALWLLTMCASVGNWWLLGKTARRRRERALADLAALVELDRARRCTDGHHNDVDV